MNLGRSVNVEICGLIVSVTMIFLNRLKDEKENMQAKEA